MHMDKLKHTLTYFSTYYYLEYKKLSYIHKPNFKSNSISFFKKNFKHKPNSNIHFNLQTNSGYNSVQHVTLVVNSTQILECKFLKKLGLPFFVSLHANNGTLNAITIM